MEHYDAPTLLAIRKQCFCNDGSSSAKRMVTYLSKTQSIKDFVVLFNAKEKYGSMEYVNEHKILMCYPECYCACVKRINEQLPVTWCYCTIGYVTHLFSQVFDHPVEVHLIESVKTGGTRCAISVEW